MTENFISNNVTERVDHLHIACSKTHRADLILTQCIFVITLTTCHFLWYRTHEAIPSDSAWILVPICLLGDAVLLTFVLLGNGLRLATTIYKDGTACIGIAKYRFPEPMTATVAKTEGIRTPPRYWIDLRYREMVVRFPGADTEGQTIGLATCINQWIKRHIRGAHQAQNVAENSGYSINWGACLNAYLIVMAFLSLAFERRLDHMHEPIKFEAGVWWASAGTLALLVIGAMAIRWKGYKSAGVQRGAVVITGEALIALLLISGGTVVVCRTIQIL
jgi:hypothetical protein